MLEDEQDDVHVLTAFTSLYDCHDLKHGICFILVFTGLEEFRPKIHLKIQCIIVFVYNFWLTVQLFPHCFIL